MIKICQICGKKIYRKKRVAYKAFKNKKYCSQKCQWKSFIGHKGYWKNKKGKNTAHWKNGRKKASGGYILIYSPNHPYKDSQKYIFEHRLVMENKINRYLKAGEEIHHINSIRNDNRPENLQLFNSKNEHMKFHKLNSNL